MKHKAKQRQAGDEPTLENYPALRTWLDKINAVCLWRYDESSLRSVEAWSANGTMFIIVMYEKARGFDVFTAPNTNRIDETFIDAEQRIGLAELPPEEPSLPLNPPAMPYQLRARLIERNAVFISCGKGKGEIISHAMGPHVFWFWTYENRAWVVGPYDNEADARDALKRFEALPYGPQLRVWEV